MKLTFNRRNGIEKYELFPPIEENVVNKLQFFASIVFSGDKV